jgi:hypothetical protein
VLVERTLLSGLRHEGIKDSESRRGTHGEKRESCIKAKVMHDCTGNRLAESRSDTDRAGDCSRSDLEST